MTFLKICGCTEPEGESECGTGDDDESVHAICEEDFGDCEEDDEEGDADGNDSAELGDGTWHVDDDENDEIAAALKAVNGQEKRMLRADSCCSSTFSMSSMTSNGVNSGANNSSSNIIGSSIDSANADWKCSRLTDDELFLSHNAAKEYLDLHVRYAINVRVAEGVVDGAQFGYETKGCNDDSSKCSFVTCRERARAWCSMSKNGAVKFIASDPIKDFAIVQIMDNPGWYVKAHGYLQIRNGQAKAGEVIYVPQHPKGDAKKIAMALDNDPKTPATSTKVGVCVDLPDQIARTNLIELSADAKTSSSGSPVISAKDHLIVDLLFSDDCKASSALPCQTLSSRLSQIVGDNEGIAFSP